MSHLVATQLWEGSYSSIIRLVGLPLQPRDSAPMRVSRITLHQTGGTLHRGIEGVENLATHWVSVRRCVQPYHYVVTPGAVCGGRLAVWQTAPDSWTSPLAPGAITVGIVGWYPSRWSSLPGPRVDPTTLMMLDDLLGYLRHRYSLPASSLSGGWELGSPADPGDELESWIRAKRTGAQLSTWEPPVSLPVVWPDGYYQRPTSCERVCELLSAQGVYRGGSTRVPTDELSVALAAFQGVAGLQPTGLLDLHTEAELRRRCAGVLA